MKNAKNNNKDDRDMTNRKQAKELLRESERKLATLIDSLPGMAYRSANQEDWPIEFASDGALELTGCTPADFMSQKVVYGELIHPEDVKYVWAAVQEKVRQKLPYVLEYRIRTASGQMKWVWEKGMGVFSKDGQLEALEGFVTDITERKLAEEKLAGKTTLLNNILRSASDVAIATTDLDFRITYYNPMAEKLFGYTSAEVIGKTIMEMHTKEKVTPERFEQAIEIVRREGQYLYSLTQETEDGPRYLESRVAGIFNPDGEMVGFSLFSRDVTERKQAEEQIQSSLKEKELLLKEVHHRTKNNFQVIASMLYLQSEYASDKKVSGILDRCYDRIKSMAAVHEQLYKTEDISSIDFAEYVHNLLVSLYHSFGVSEKTVAFRISIDNIFLGLDVAIPCGLIINELFSNSLMHAFGELKERDKQKAQICVDMHKANDHKFILVVSDNGIGLAGGLDSMDGQSLGLYLVKNLAEQLDGTVEIDTDKGTRFTIKFPYNMG